MEVTYVYSLFRRYFFIYNLIIFKCEKGSLIGEVWVLTTASCVQDARSVQVILGAHDISQAETTQQNITSMDISSHPDFDPVTLQNDVAVIKLPLAAKLTSQYPIKKNYYYIKK